MQLRSLAAALFGVLAFACGSDPIHSTPPPASSAEPVTCDEPTYADATLMGGETGTVTLTVHDPDGAAVVGTPVTVCGVNVCSDIKHTDMDGTTSVPAISAAVIKPALKFGDALTYAELAILLDDPAKGGVFSELTLPALPATGDPILPGGTATSNGVTLTLTKDATFKFIDNLTYTTPDSQALRAAELTPDHFPDGLDHGAGLERIFTLAPLGAKICPPATLSLPNSAAWDPGTSVEFLVQGLQVEEDEPFAPYGEWQSVATGVVDPSGATLVTTLGGLPIVSNVGVRRL
jgi:hypothetical protein